MSKTQKKDWKNFDIKAAASQDLGAAIAFLQMIRDNPQIMELVVKAIEEWRKTMIVNEKAEK